MKRPFFVFCFLRHFRSFGIDVFRFSFHFSLLGGRLLFRRQVRHMEPGAFSVFRF
jgi:hypothetical protein